MQQNKKGRQCWRCTTRGTLKGGAWLQATNSRFNESNSKAVRVGRGEMDTPSSMQLLGYVEENAESVREERIQLSSFGGDLNSDFSVSFTEKQRRTGAVDYN